ncbi:hypothetical protein [Paraburkholderia sp. J41]|uniref:hypothetical protein n=1 Tax=Paraburkholderia sp. J41 TaxID=2805433 RepID=UPI002AC36930|nr:hypothetical protein [Paraburkholderia sp. J41]
MTDIEDLQMRSFAHSLLIAALIRAAGLSRAQLAPVIENCKIELRRVPDDGTFAEAAIAYIEQLIDNTPAH